MTPKEFLKIEAQQRIIILKSQGIIREARAKAEKCEMPKKIRVATSEDVFQGNIIWYKKCEYHDAFWKVIETCMYPEGAFKTYVADDGCRYGLEGAFVEVEKNETSTR